MASAEETPVAGRLSSFSQDANRPRVLIVEHEFVIAMLIRDMAHELGYGVSGFANDPYSAQDELGKHNFDAVLLDDVGLNGQRSVEIADLLTEMKVPFVFVTGHTQPSEPRHAKVPTLHKPFTVGQLRDVLHALVGPPHPWRQEELPAKFS